MRIIVMSDSHGSSEAVMKIVEKNIYTADMFIHLGDGENDTWRALQKYPQIKMMQIRGNCDQSNTLPDKRIIETIPDLDNKPIKLLAVHGHLLDIKKGTDELLKAARENECRIALFGHTHRRYEACTSGIWVLNPGSCACPKGNEMPSYGYIDISVWGIITGIIDLL